MTSRLSKEANRTLNSAMPAALPSANENALDDNEVVRGVCGYG
jgi:hypothetical protein